MPRSFFPMVSFAAAIVAAAGMCAPLAAQERYYGQTQPGLGASGRDFGGVQLPVTLRSGDVTIRASRAWVWNEGASNGGGGAVVVGLDGNPVGTQRLLLQGDVTVELDGYRFTSAQAVVWSQIVGAVRTGEAADNGDRQLRQIAVYFDRVADPGAEAGYAQAADRLLVTAQLDGLFNLSADSITRCRPEDPAQSGFLGEAERRMAAYLHELAGGPPPAETNPPPVEGGGRTDRISPGLARPYEPNSPLARPREGGSESQERPIEQRTEPLFAKNGLVTFAVGTRAPNSPAAPDFGEQVGDSSYIRLIPAGDDNAVLLTGGVAMQYTDLRKTRNLLITAQRALVFLPPGKITDTQRFNADEIRGIYLEGDVVATDGQYTIRGPRIYYDFKLNKAVMADAVFSTVDAKTGLPFYIRAKSLRQEAANQVSAEDARLSTTSFFQPVFSIGASSVTVTETQSKSSAAATEGGGGGGNRKITYVDAKGITLRGMGVPFFWLPGFKGEIEKVALQDIRVESSSGSGAALKTTWDAFALFGARSPESINSRLLLDYYFDRGFAMGTRTDWSRPDLTGQVFAYMLTNDNGRDVLSNGVKKEQDQQFRGIVLAENRWDIDNHWSVFAEASKISDETFVDGFFRDLGSEGREVTTEATLRYLGSNSYFSAGAKG
ncbi:MAG TPA: hypothetical protein VHC70_03540, partial [Phycisphaerales bacterium]|nr:hypothetical protein [Phycisphaerales bacterium]